MIAKAKKIGAQMNSESACRFQVFKVSNTDWLVHFKPKASDCRAANTENTHMHLILQLYLFLTAHIMCTML